MSSDRRVVLVGAARHGCGAYDDHTGGQPRGPCGVVEGRGVGGGEAVGHAIPPHVARDGATSDAARYVVSCAWRRSRTSPSSVPNMMVCATNCTATLVFSGNHVQPAACAMT